MTDFTDRQRDFLEAAITIVSEQGFSKLTIRNVAAAVGVSEPAVYRHFPSKLALLTAMLEDLQGSLLPHFYALRKDKSPAAERLANFIHGLFSEFKIRPAYAPFIFSEEIFHAEPMLRERLREVMSENILLLTESIRAFQTSGECRGDIGADELALITLGSIRLAVTRWHISSGRLRLKDLSDKLVATLSLLFGL